MLEGTVTKSTGKFYEIRPDHDKNKVTAVVRGKFKLKGLPLTNPVAVGDRVGFVSENDISRIKKIFERDNYVARQSPRKKHALHLMASNIDQVVLIVTIVQPKIKQGFIDRFLLMTEPYHIPVHLVFNKVDLYTEQDMNVFRNLKTVYEDIGYNVLTSSTKTLLNVDLIKGLLDKKTTMFAGQSGVGKSSLINLVIPGLSIRTEELSGYTGKGQHTTTFAEMFDIDEQSHIIDTPGIKNLSFNHLEVMDVAHNFKEFFEASEKCKYGNCTHRNEPKCAVKEKVENGTIHILRYQNYLQILEGVENQNYWERIKKY